MAYRRSPGARVALLRSPILPTARGRIAKRDRGVQPQIIPGDEHSRVRKDDVPLTADILTLAKQRTFLSWSDSFLGNSLHSRILEYIVNFSCGIRGHGGVSNRLTTILSLHFHSV